ncbi:MAG: hypothetical protein JWR37_5564 [Mycobacterium sp.]|jgi:hypothetical protein|nr:hypothetical protein [Mycobacterium sp.]
MVARLSGHDPLVLLVGVSRNFGTVAGHGNPAFLVLTDEGRDKAEAEEANEGCRADDPPDELDAVGDNDQHPDGAESHRGQRGRINEDGFVAEGSANPVAIAAACP